MPRALGAFPRLISRHVYSRRLSLVRNVEVAPKRRLRAAMTRLLELGSDLSMCRVLDRTGPPVLQRPQNFQALRSGGHGPHLVTGARRQPKPRKPSLMPISDLRVSHRRQPRLYKARVVEQRPRTQERRKVQTSEGGALIPEVIAAEKHLHNFA
ncbi:hypothetical protein Tco_0250859 [Tanacetum coccineum]